ncbi:MAG TPA: Ig-like domain-containing protein [Terriglobales bacterium]|nr:Ig-like domain-containing protein [Terriglobales bacterium]
MFSRFKFGMLVALLLLGLAACDNFFIGPNDLSSFTISPLNPAVKPTGTVAFSASGYFGDGSTRDITSTVTWTSSNTSIATIDSTGTATGVALGSTTITATDGSMKQSTTLTVSNKVVNSIALSPSNPTVISGSQQQLTATATFSDNTTQDVTSSATWTSSNSAAATVNAGLVTGVATGTATITVSYQGVTATTTVTVQ